MFVSSHTVCMIIQKLWSGILLFLLNLYDVVDFLTVFDNTNKLN